MRLSNLADYAVVTMSAAARHCGGARPSGGELAAETGPPAPTGQYRASRLTRAGGTTPPYYLYSDLARTQRVDFTNNASTTVTSAAWKSASAPVSARVAP